MAPPARSFATRLTIGASNDLAGQFSIGRINNREALNYVPFIEIPEEGINFQNVVTDMERELILQSLRKTNGNKKLAAKLLNLKRTTLIEKIKRIGLGEQVAASA